MKKNNNFKLKYILVSIVQCIWGFPQTLMGFIGFIFVLLFGDVQEIKYHKGVILVETGDYWGGISLGLFVFSCSKEYYPHEYGHTIQSLIVGWFYLFVIGIPSLIRSMGSGDGYLEFYTERWAEVLGAKYYAEYKN